MNSLGWRVCEKPNSPSFDVDFDYDLVMNWNIMFSTQYILVHSSKLKCYLACWLCTCSVTDYVNFGNVLVLFESHFPYLRNENHEEKNSKTKLARWAWRGQMGSKVLNKCIAQRSSSSSLKAYH